jgi:hypothetical protein
MNDYAFPKLLKKPITTLVASALFLHSTSAFSYGTWTHGAKTAFAFNQAQIMKSNSEVIDRLGLTELLALDQNAPLRASL